jgi:hypothetical protein
MLTEAVRKYNVVSQMGNQGRSGEGTRRLASGSGQEQLEIFVRFTAGPTTSMAARNR